MLPGDRMRADFAAALDGASPGLATAERICAACVDLLAVDGASISLVHAGSNFGTYGSSSELSRRLDEYQFTFGEGPCLDAVREAQPILVADLDDPAEHRWPVYAAAVLQEGVHAVYALPVSMNSACVGALDLFRAQPGRLHGSALAGGLIAADLARLPLLDLLTATAAQETDPEATPDESVWPQPATLERVEVYQATGMVMAQLGVDAEEALVRLRAHAFAEAMTASELAWRIVRREYRFEPDQDNRRGRGLEGEA